MGPIQDPEQVPNGQSVELTPELKALVGRLENGDGLNLTQNGVVVARLHRVEPSQPEDDATVVARQQAALADLLARLAKLPPEPELDDGLSGSVDHDEILYGER